MPKVIAVFDSGTHADKAVDELNAAGYGDDVRVVMPTNASTSDTSLDGVAAVPSSQGGGAVVGLADDAEPTMAYSTLDDLGLGSEEEEFYSRTLGEGSQLICVETNDGSAVRSLLEKVGASRVDEIT